MKKIFPVFVILALFASCKGDKGDTSTPTITNTQPADNAVFTSGQTINIRGTLSDNDLHAGTITITNDAGGGTLGSPIYLSIHGISTYNINESWVAAASVVTNATITIQASDYTGNTAEKKIPIRINP